MRAIRTFVLSVLTTLAGVSAVYADTPTDPISPLQNYIDEAVNLLEQIAATPLAIIAIWSFWVAARFLGHSRLGFFGNFVSVFRELRTEIWRIVVASVIVAMLQDRDHVDALYWYVPLSPFIGIGFALLYTFVTPLIRMLSWRRVRIEEVKKQQPAGAPRDDGPL